MTSPGEQAHRKVALAAPASHGTTVQTLNNPVWISGLASTYYPAAEAAPSGQAPVTALGSHRIEPGHRDRQQTMPECRWLVNSHARASRTYSSFPEWTKMRKTPEGTGRELATGGRKHSN